jgi:hypothetical protein
MKDRSFFADTSEDEKEITVVIDKKTSTAVICSTWWNESIRLAKKYGEPFKTSRRDGKVTAAFWRVPADRISFRALSKGKRIMSDEAKAAFRARMSKTPIS